MLYICWGPSQTTSEEEEEEEEEKEEKEEEEEEEEEEEDKVEDERCSIYSIDTLSSFTGDCSILVSLNSLVWGHGYPYSTNPLSPDFCDKR